MTVGFYAPLPPARTGVADYAAALLAELRTHGRVEVAPSTCDVALYHLGNNGQHGDIYQRALDVPGVVVLHDAVLHHFLLGRLKEAAYIEEFVYNYGEWNRGLAQELWRGRASSGTDRRYFEYSILKRIVERSLAVVVHNPAAARVVARVCGIETPLDPGLGHKATSRNAESDGAAGKSTGINCAADASGDSRGGTWASRTDQGVCPTIVEIPHLFVPRTEVHCGADAPGERQSGTRVSRADQGVSPTIVEIPQLFVPRTEVNCGADDLGDRQSGTRASRADQGVSPTIVEIPHLFVPLRNLPGAAEAMRWRQRMAVELGTFLFGVFGYLRESKRLVAVLEAFANLHRDNPRTALLIAGQFVSTDLERAVAPMLAGPGVVRLPHLPEREFWLAAQAVDACINLRYPPAGETSGIAIRLMGLGKPVMMTESLECSRFPEDACIRVASGAGERDSLLEHMMLLASMPGVAAAIGERAAAYIQAHHRVEDVASQYWRLLSSVTQTSARI